MATAWLEIDALVNISDETLDAMDTYPEEQLAVYFEGFDPLTLEKDGVV